MGRATIGRLELPPGEGPPRHLEPPLSVGEVGRLNPYHGEDLPMRFTARLRVGGRHAARRIFGCVSRPAPGGGRRAVGRWCHENSPSYILRHVCSLRLIQSSSPITSIRCNRVVCAAALLTTQRPLDDTLTTSRATPAKHWTNRGTPCITRSWWRCATSGRTPAQRIRRSGARSIGPERLAARVPTPRAVERL